jgi:hypothetical protein
MTTKVTLLYFCERVSACRTGLITIFVYCLLKGGLETFVMYAEECLLRLILQCDIFFSLLSGLLEFNSYYLLSEIHNVLDKNLVDTWTFRHHAPVSYLKFRSNGLLAEANDIFGECVLI